MPLSSKLDRKLRAADDSSDGEDYYEVTDRSSSESVIETGAGDAQVLSSGDEGGDNVDASDDDDGDSDQAQAQISKISFGALAKAQDALAKDQVANRKRKREADASASQEDKLELLRKRLRQIKAEKMANGAKPEKKAGGSKKNKVIQEDESEDDNAQEDDSDDSDADAAPKARSSKHAPAVQSSKRMVSRKRKVVDVKKPVFRDPRFDNVGGAAPDENTLGHRYAFLNEYKASEIAELKSTIKKSKNEVEKEKLKKKLMSMESQQKTQQRKDQQQEIVREHKKKEKELVKEGKQPFYLKKSEQKKLALIDRFENMKSKDRDRAIERRRKKVTGKEKKNLPERR